MSQESIPERDKPFFLAIISSAVTILTISIAAIGAFLSNETMIEVGLEALKFTLPLTTMAWTFYFKSRG